MRSMVGILAGVALTVVTTTALAQGMKAEVMHQWTSAGESAAVKEIADQFNKAGGEWVDAAITGEENMVAAELARVVGGNPPTAMQFPMGKQMVDLASQGLLENIDDVAAEGNWAAVLPGIFLQAITYDGHIYGVPVQNHGQSWLWYNKAVLEKVGAKEPVTWEDLFATAEKLKAAGVIPIAVGGQSWQLRITFNTVLVTKGGADLYTKVLGDRDEAAIRSPEFKDVVETYLKIRDYADPGNANRDWNVAANMVITGQAGFNFMGDWAKGEYTAAGQTAGKEFGCVLLGENGDQNFIVSSDTFVFPKNSGPVGCGDAEALCQGRLRQGDPDPVQRQERLRPGADRHRSLTGRRMLADRPQGARQPEATGAEHRVPRHRGLRRRGGRSRRPGLGGPEHDRRPVRRQVCRHRKGHSIDAGNLGKGRRTVRPALGFAWPPAFVETRSRRNAAA